MFSTTDTIVGIATPQGRGGIGVVRVSGTAALTISSALLAREAPLEPRRATFTRVLRADQSNTARRTAIDQVIATYFPGPHSYTGDDVVEISSHGSGVLLREIVEAAMTAGARLAEPGEFTFRAFLNGRIDLVQAEAIADLVDAVTPAQARIAFDQLEGTLTRAIGRIHDALFDLVARLEASLDFPDEGYHFVRPHETAGEIEGIRSQLHALLCDAGRGRLIREGGTAVILGKPNVGKSSIFNMLVGSGRAIVTPIPGTTRDLVTERIDIEGIPLTLVDTAGLRQTTDPIESEGVERAQRALDVANIAIVVLDSSLPLGPDDTGLLARTVDSARVVIVNKSDLPGVWRPETIEELGTPWVRLSTFEDAGLDHLRKAIATAVMGREPVRDTPALSNIRHIDLLKQASSALERARETAMAGQPEELVLADLHGSRAALESITGVRTSDDVLTRIFERFCIGK